MLDMSTTSDVPEVTVMGTATPVKWVANEPPYRCAMVYHLDPPAKFTSYDEDDNPYDGETEYVVVSALRFLFWHETVIFPCDADCNVLPSDGMEGSEQDTFDHERVLNNAGYAVAEVEGDLPHTEWKSV